MSYIHTSGDTSETRPTRVRLPDSTTRTMEAVTDEILAEAGWSWQEPVVEPVAVQLVDIYPATSGTVMTEE